MSVTTTTGAGSNGSEADKADQSATGGDTNTETGDGSNNKLQELESTLTGWAQKTRKLDKGLKELTSKIDTVLSRLTPSSNSDDDDDDDDDDGDEGGGGEGAAAGTKAKPTGEAAKHPEVKRLLKKLDRERKERDEERKQSAEREGLWKGRFEQLKKQNVLTQELQKHKVLPHALGDLVEQLERKIDVQVDDDGAIEVTHQDYPTVSKFIEEFLNERPHLLPNERASGTGDGGGAQRNSAGGGGAKLPHGFATWPAEKQREYATKLPAEQRRQLLKSMGI